MALTRIPPCIHLSFIATPGGITAPVLVVRDFAELARRGFYPLTIAFNPTYLTDGLGSLHSEQVTFGFTTPSRPAVLRPASEDDGNVGATGPFPAAQTDYVYLLMPVRLPG